MGNASGFAEMDRQIARLRTLSKFVATSATVVAVAVRRELASQIDAGVGPDGKSWPPTEGGGRALRGAAAALSVRAVGTVVLATLTGVEARHHFGAVRGKVKREILPTGKIPDPVTRAITRVLTGEFNAIMGPMGPK